VRACRPELTDEQIIAVAQHYSKEAGTPTHLIDVTWDPLIALFFASDGARAADVGVVDHIVVPEWRKLVASEAGNPGALRVIEVPRVKRIERQHRTPAAPASNNSGGSLGERALLHFASSRSVSISRQAAGRPSAIDDENQRQARRVPSSLY
jgi:hypothetical protein